VLSLPDAVGQALAENFLGVSYGSEQGGQGSVMGVEGHTKQIPATEPAVMASGWADICPSCGDAAFVREEGCQSCHACGYSEC
jgi:ribonucleoside-diphosphate reductase alpha chain